MRGTLTIAKREVLSFVFSPVAYVVLTVWLLVQGVSLWGFAQFFASQANAPGAVTHTPLTLFFGGSTLFYLFLIVISSALTMRLMAEERRSGTIESLLTTPITELQVVLGKYLAAMTFWVGLWVPTLLYVWILSRYGDIDWGVVGASYFGVCVIGAYYMGIGLLTSTVSRSQIVAALLSFLVLGVLFMLGVFEFIFQDTDLGEAFGYVSIWGHMEDFAKGIVDSRPLVFSASLAALTLFLALGVVRSDHIGQGKGSSGAVAHGGGSLLALAIVVMVNYLSFRHYERWDWTAQGMYTLSDRTEQELEALDTPIEFHLFLSSAEPNFPEVRELLERYRAGSELFSVQYVDPDRDPARYQVLAERFGIGAATLESGQTLADVAGVMTAGEKRWTVTRDDLVGMDFSSFDEDGGPKVDVKAEQAITGALVQVTSGRATQVCVSSGHGEWALGAGDDRSLYALADELRRDNVELTEVDTLGGGSIDEECDALFVIGPQRAHGPAEAESIETYLEAGGNVLLALEPVLDRERIDPTGLEELLSDLGVRIDSSLVLETDAGRLIPPGNPAGPFLVTSYGAHRTTEALGRMGGAVVFSMARSVRPAEQGAVTSLLQTSERGWAETDLAGLDPSQAPEPDDRDIRGPVSLAVATRIETTGAANQGPDAEEHAAGEGPLGGRLVVIGDADWLQSAPMRDPRFANLDLALALSGWLTERETLISIPAKQIDAQPTMITEDDLLDLFLRLVLLMPAAMVLLGFAAWWSRRQ